MAQKQLQIQKQTQNISPQQLMVVGMLSCNVQEIEERIKKELEENPALEKTENLSNIKSSSDGETYNADEEYYTGEYSDESDYKEGEKYDEMGDFSNLGSDGYDYYDGERMFAYTCYTIRDYYACKAFAIRERKTSYACYTIWNSKACFFFTKSISYQFFSIFRI